MIYFDNESKIAAFYFATEEYIMRDIKPTEAVYLVWQTGDTVMVGANQILDIEIDREYALSQGISVVRRSSGGGAIYTDSGTLLFSIILPYSEDMDPKAIANEYFSKHVAGAIAGLGVTASPEGRNDIQIDEKKISGIAQYMKYGYLCTHGSLLFNADLEKLSRVLTVDQEKIMSKALRSVKSRVTNIADYTEVKDISALKKGLIKQCNSEQKEFDANDLVAIRKIMKEKYESVDWTLGHNPPFTFRNSYRFKDGKIDILLEVKNGKVEGCSIFGDFLAIKPVSVIEDAIKGSLYRRDALTKAISEIKLAEYFGAVSQEELLDLLLGNDLYDGGFHD